jgi:hypothetical protein
MASMSETPDKVNRTINESSTRAELVTHPNEAPQRHELATSRSQPPATLPRGSSILDHAFNSLPVEKQHELMETALQKKIEIETKAADAAQAYRNFDEETKGSVEHVRQLGKTGMDVTGTYEGRTASGRWQVEVRKSNYTVIMVIAAIVGIVALIVALR